MFVCLFASRKSSAVKEANATTSTEGQPENTDVTTPMMNHQNHFIDTKVQMSL